MELQLAITSNEVLEHQRSYLTVPQSEVSTNFSPEIDRTFAAKVWYRAAAAHECGHAVCALANGMDVLKIQNGLRRQFTIYDAATVPNTHVRRIVSVAGPLAGSEFLKQLSLRSEVCSPADAAHLLGYEEEYHLDIATKFEALDEYGNNIQVAGLKASLEDHLMDGKNLPSEFQHLLPLIDEARSTLMEHRSAHTNLVAALFNKGGVLRKGDVQRIWQTTHNAVQARA